MELVVRSGECWLRRREKLAGSEAWTCRTVKTQFGPQSGGFHEVAAGSSCSPCCETPDAVRNPAM